MIENVAMVFDPSGRDEFVRKVEEVIRESGNLKKVNDFLEGKSKRHHIFFYFQKPDVTNDNNELVDGPGEPRITIQNGETERYFVIDVVGCVELDLIEGKFFGNVGKKFYLSDVVQSFKFQKCKSLMHKKNFTHKHSG